MCALEGCQEKKQIGARSWFTGLSQFLNLRQFLPSVTISVGQNLEGKRTKEFHLSGERMPLSRKRKGQKQEEAFGHLLRRGSQSLSTFSSFFKNKKNPTHTKTKPRTVPVLGSLIALSPFLHPFLVVASSLTVSALLAAYFYHPVMHTKNIQ